MLAQSQEFIGAMNRDELQRAIEEPARRGHWEFEPGLVDMLLHDVGAEPGALPLLSHALFETWQRRRGRLLTLSGYTSSGGVRGAIAETAETVFADQLTRDQQIIARRIFLRLTELGGESTSGDTRRRISFEELVHLPEETAEIQIVLNKLAEARLITVNSDSIEVAHEALIREWPTLRAWLEDDRECLRLHRSLSQAAHEWLAMEHEPDMLLRGARLAQVREWAGANIEELNPLEREFLEASTKTAEQEAMERELQRQHELQVAQKLAEAEKQRAEVESQRAQEQARLAGMLRRRAYYLAGALTLTLAMVLIALFSNAQARRAAASALHQQQISFSRELAAAAVSNLDIDPERSILLAANAVSLTYAADQTWTPEAEDALRRSLLASRLETTLRSHTNRVNAVAYSPDGLRLASASDDGTVKIWKIEPSGEIREEWSIITQANRGRHGLAFSPDGKHLATASGFGIVGIWDVLTGQEFLILKGHSDWISAVAFSPDGRRLVTGSEDRTAIVWDAVTAQPLATLSGHSDQVTDAAFNQDGSRLVSASLDGTARIWDAATFQKIAELTEYSGAVYGVAFSPDGKRLATAANDRTANIWDASTFEKILTFRGHTDGLWDVSFSPDGYRLASTGYDGQIILWDASTGQELLRLAGHTQAVTSAAFSPDCADTDGAQTELCGTHLVSGSLDGTVKVWNVSFSREYQALTFPNVSSGKTSPDGSHFATGQRDGSVAFWQMTSPSGGWGAYPKLVTAWPAHAAAVTAVTFSPDGKRLATASDDFTARVWDLAPVVETASGSSLNESTSAKELQVLRGHSAQVWNIAFSPQGNRLATVSNDRTLLIWDTSTAAPTGDNRPLLKIQLPSWSYAIAFSPDGKRLAAGLNDGTGKIWDVASGTELMTLRGHDSEIWGIAFSPDGKFIATASNDRTVIVWDAASGQESLTLKGHSGAVNSVAFSPDGKILASASQDGTVKVWEFGALDSSLSAEPQPLTLYGNTSPVIAVDFSPDGSRLLSAGLDGVVRLYVLQIDDLLTLARTRVTRALTGEECRQFLHRTPAQCSGTAEKTSANPESMPGMETTIAIPEERTDNASVEVNTLGAPIAPGAAGASGAAKVCELTDETGVNDEFFNQVAYQGVQEASKQLGWESALVEPTSPGEYQAGIANLVEAGCDLIVAPTGAFFNDVILTAARAYPLQKFQIFEWGNELALENVWEQSYAIDQASFLAGYLAASVTKTGVVATFGGVAFPAVTDFMDGFARGVAYYNEKNGRTIQVLGWDTQAQDGIFAGNFTNTADGRKIAEILMDQGADVLLPIAGPLGLGAAAAALERGSVFIIGVDTDWALTYPEYADILLTSIQKRLDRSVLAAVQAIHDGTFSGGLYLGTLANGGVSLAPFHNLEALATPQVKAELAAVEAGIITGQIQTRP
jgi:WD40 repeat protein/basic membrane lipoprotein Med (substrate-binding protein (PBP1-ABC) superfamily)